MEKIDLYTIDELRTKGWTINFSPYSIPGAQVFYRENFHKTLPPKGVYNPKQYEQYYLRECLDPVTGTLQYDTKITYNDFEAVSGNANVYFMANDTVPQVRIYSGMHMSPDDVGPGLTVKGITIGDRRLIKIKTTSLTKAGENFMTLDYSPDNGTTWFRVAANAETQEETGVEGSEYLWSVPIGSTKVNVTKEWAFEIQRTAPGQTTLAISIGRGEMFGAEDFPVLYEVSGEFLEESGIELSMRKTWGNPDPAATTKGIVYNETNRIAGTYEDAEQVARMYGSAIEYGMDYTYPPPPPVEPMFFPKEELYQWISPQQMTQFESMYPNCVEVAYNNALGTIYSQIGALFDIPAIIAGVDIDDGTTKVFKWILEVLTAYNILAPAPQRSDAMESNYRMAIAKLIEIKNGASSSPNAPLKAEPNTMGVIVKRGAKMLG